MLFTAKAVFLLSSIATLAFAQGQGDLPKCAQNCVGNTLTQTGCQTSDIKCICSSAGYIQNLSCCVANQCDPQDIQNTINFANNICSLQGVTTLPKSATCASTNGMMSSTGAPGAAGGASSMPVGSSMATATMSAGGESMMSGGSSATNTMMSGSSATAAHATGAAGRDFVGLGAAAVAGVAGVGALVL